MDDIPFPMLTPAFPWFKTISIIICKKAVSQWQSSSNRDRVLKELQSFAYRRRFIETLGCWPARLPKPSAVFPHKSPRRRQPHAMVRPNPQRPSEKAAAVLDDA
jgi:hypothetical protein